MSGWCLSLSLSLSLSRKDRLSCKRRMKERCEKVSAKGLEGVGEGRGIATRGEVRRCGVRGGRNKRNLIRLKKRVKRSYDITVCVEGREKKEKE